MVLDYYGLFHNAHRQGADLDKIPVGFNMKLNGSKIPLDKILVPKDFIFNNHPSHLDFAIFEIAQQRIEPLEFFEIPEIGKFQNLDNLTVLIAVLSSAKR